MINIIGNILHSLRDGVVTGFPLGLLLGVALAPARVSGVDFRQWFKDPAQPSDVDDDSWIGLMRDAANVLVGAFLLALFIAALWRWFPWPSTPHGVLDFLALYLGFWAQWPILVGIAVGVAAAQLVAEAFWRVGLAILANPAPPARLLAPRPRAAVPNPARARAPRRLIICCDGTWNWPDQQRETNVVRLLRSIPAAAPGPTGIDIPQIVHYHLGVGTGNFVDRIVGGAAGVGLSNSVKACYGFLVDNYVPGDEIFLFGFSRGAYVARSVAGVVGIVGILRKSEMEHFIEVWDWYSDHNHRNPNVLQGLAPHRHQNVDIECVGVWDTVGALGIPGTRFCAKSFTFHETGLGQHVRHAFQALAIDEARGNFQAAVWVPNPAAQDQVLEQVWFPGVHSNIGGGYVKHGLSDTALLWMLCRIDHWHLLEIDWTYVAQALDSSEPYPSGTLADSRTLAWKVLGCPVPRPVGITSDSESIHESAWEVVDAAYQRRKRRSWLNAMTARAISITPCERSRYVTTMRPRVQPPRVSSRLGWCDRLMQFIGGNG